MHYACMYVKAGFWNELENKGANKWSVASQGQEAEMEAGKKRGDGTAEKKTERLVYRIVYAHKKISYVTG